MSPTKEAVLTQNSPAPLPQFSQAIKYNGMVYCSGSIGINPATKELVKGGVQPETRAAIKNLSAVLEAAGSSLNNIVKVNVFLTTMDDFAPMNQVYDEFFGSINPKPRITSHITPVNQSINHSRFFLEFSYITALVGNSLMSLNTGARLMRVQPTLVHGIHHRSSSASAIALRLSPSLSQISTNSRVASLRFLYRNNASQTQFRPASTSSASRPKLTNTPNGNRTPDRSSEKPPSSPEPLSDPLNPPASTRPPPLDLPVRDPATNIFFHLIELGKAYTTFYKTGLKAVFINRRLLRDLRDTFPPNLPSPAALTRGSSLKTTLSPTLDKSANPTRASLLLRDRVRHDISRLPVFALIVLICGEFTPFVVLLFPQLTPYTCRIPAQVAVIRRSIESRRAASFRALSYVDNNSSSSESSALLKVADGHICRSLGLGSTLWDKMGFDVLFAKSRAEEVVSRIVQDDIMLRNGGGVSALIDDEVVLACEERGIDTLGKDIASLRDRLEAWVTKSKPSQPGDVEMVLKEAADRVRGLLLGLDGPI
ncbi:hypothetical protein E0Z10_g10826 [Xylaria hypoxylon]|uniref:Letm1 RBD domain-containing protein n=1 Tax=Xylaria hypoxylon TaxID=37992 RepID=A0A4Z0YIX7_9PEZI|nr:hypothetical protein E0Z10_g10826 [Xylaria hypoxylon]